MAKRRSSKIIIDTNIWVSFLLTNEYTKLDSFFADKHVELIFGQELLGEFIEVAQRPKFKKYFSSADLDELLIQIGYHAIFVDIKENVNICRDPKDNFLLALAQTSKATHLITGDKDLLSLKSFGKTKIVTMAGFLTQK